MDETVARMRVKPGTGTQLEPLSQEQESLDVDGHMAASVYQLDSGPDDDYLIAILRDRESYTANAVGPARDDRFRRMRDVLADDPTWHDGEIAWSMIRPTA